jgi:hypothetical protein
MQIRTKRIYDPPVRSDGRRTRQGAGAASIARAAISRFHCASGKSGKTRVPVENTAPRSRSSAALASATPRVLVNVGEARVDPERFKVTFAWCRRLPEENNLCEDVPRSFPQHRVVDA